MGDTSLVKKPMYQSQTDLEMQSDSHALLAGQCYFFSLR